MFNSFESTIIVMGAIMVGIFFIVIRQAFLMRNLKKMVFAQKLKYSAWRKSVLVEQEIQR